jgi:3-isopropylmalate dehydrogenase
MKPLKFLAIAIHEIIWTPALTGACAIDAVGVPYPDETHEICMKADAVLFGAIGHKIR